MNGDWVYPREEGILTANFVTMGQTFPIGTYVTVSNRIMKPNGVICFTVQVVVKQGQVAVFDVPTEIVDTSKVALIKWKMGYR